MASNSTTEICLNETYGNARINLFKLPEDLRDVNMELLDRMLTHSAEALSFLVTGRTGAGKSTFINGILGMRMGDEKHATESGSEHLDACTTELMSFKKTLEGVVATVWDTRGLLDGASQQKQEASLKKMVRECSNVDLKLFCIDMNQKRFVRGTNNADVLALIIITEAFGVGFWRNAMIVLTFANNISLGLPKIPVPTKQKKAEAFTKILNSWKEKLEIILREDVRIPQDIVKSIPVVPAGHYEEWQLPDRDYWLSDLWFQCLYALSTPEAQGALIKITKDRLKSTSEITESDLSQPPWEQPIILPADTTSHKMNPSRLKDILTVMSCAAGGAGSGAVIGLTALVAGPLGGAIGIPAGAVMGFCIGLALGVHKIQDEPTNIK